MASECRLTGAVHCDDSSTAVQFLQGLLVFVLCDYCSDRGVLYNHMRRFSDPAQYDAIESGRIANDV